MSESLTLKTPRDRLGLFEPLALGIMRETDLLLEELSFELYTKGLTTRDIESLIENI